MTDETTQSRKLSWQWVGITLAMYIVFYVVPVTLGFRFASGRAMGIFLGIWSFGGILVIAATAGYLSKGVTLWEPAIAGLILTTLLMCYGMIRIITTSVGHRSFVFQIVLPWLTMSVMVFLLSLLGAWFGEMVQKHWKNRPSEA